MKLESNRDNKGMRLGIIGIVFNLLLVALKLIVGVIVSSVSLIGDAFNNLSDTFSSFINMISFKFNSKPADKEHPYGHKRSEYIGGLLISVLILIVAIELFISSIKEIINPSSLMVSWYLLLVVSINFVIKGFMAIIYYLGYKKIDSISLKASFKDSISDILVNLLIVVGLFASKYMSFNLDGYLGIGLSFFILYGGVSSLKEAISKLLGEPLEEEKINSICELIVNHNEIIGIHDVLTHKYGEDMVYMSVHVEMNASLSLIAAHEIIDELERKIKKEYKIEIIIHIDPVDFSDTELAKLKNVIAKTLNGIDEKLSYHDVRITHDKEKRVYFDLEMPYGYLDKSREILTIVSNEIYRTCGYKCSIEVNYK